MIVCDCMRRRALLVAEPDLCRWSNFAISPDRVTTIAVSTDAYGLAKVDS